MEGGKGRQRVVREVDCVYYGIGGGFKIVDFFGIIIQ